MKRREKKKKGLEESWCEKGKGGIQHLRRERGNIISFRWKLRKRRWERRKVGNVSSTRTCFLCSRCSPEPPEKWQIPLWLQRRLRDGAGSYHEWRGHIDPGRWLRGDRDRERGPGRLPRNLKWRESLTILVSFTKRKTSINNPFTSGFLPPWFCLHMASDQAHDQALRLLWRGGFTFSYFFSQTKGFNIWRIISGWGGDCCQSKHCLWHLWGWVLGRILPDQGSRSDLQKYLL